MKVSNYLLEAFIFTSYKEFYSVFVDVRKNGHKGMSCLQRNDQLSVTQYISGNIPPPVSQPDSLATYGVNPNLSAFFAWCVLSIASPDGFAICQSNQAKIHLFYYLFPFNSYTPQTLDFTGFFFNFRKVNFLTCFFVLVIFIQSNSKFLILILGI